VTIEGGGGRLAVRLTDQVLFPSGSAELSERGRALLTRVAATLRSIEDRNIVVEGHTDSTPLTGDSLARWGSNWELSTARATHVVRFLSESCEVPGDHLIASGRAAFEPLGDNETPRGRRLNRRIELTLVPR
jgi:chemotaxis protein MotB